jgi:hypothetical protein
VLHFSQKHTTLCGQVNYGVIVMYLGFAFNGEQITLNQIVKTALVIVGLLS